MCDLGFPDGIFRPRKGDKGALKAYVVFHPKMAGDRHTMTDEFHILLLSSPNINVLGTREPGRYDTLSLAEIISRLTSEAAALSVSLGHLQSNAKYVLIDRIHQARDNMDYILINPAVSTHISVAIYDVLLTVNILFIGIHLSNARTCESFRQHSYLSNVAAGVICGLGADGYLCALQTVVKRLSQSH